MNSLSEKLSAILSYGLRPGYTAVSYAMMKGDEILASDTLGTLGDKAGTPADENSTFNIGSVSKIFCTVALMQMVEQGRANLDDPVCKYLPKLWLPDERYKKITLRQCLSHSSGLPGTQWKAFTLAGTEDYDYYSDVYEFMAASRLKAEPGTNSVYCNDGFTLAEMTVAALSGEKFEDYSVKHITDPIGAESTRLVPNYHPEHPMVVEKGFPPEVMYIRACGGYTSDMRDLCRFGRQFLIKSDIISDASKAEMGKSHGLSFLKKDERRGKYGLGWDNMAFSHPSYDLGEGVLFKGGKTLQFSTKFYVIPKYDAVIAMSATDDCGLDVQETLLRLFACAMWETEGLSIYADAVPVPEDRAKEIEGVYLTATNAMRFFVYGANCSVCVSDAYGGLYPLYKPFRWDGSRFIGMDGQILDFEKNGDDLFALSTVDGLLIPMAQKVTKAAPLSEAWKKRLGKKYLVVDAGPRDLIVPNMFWGFTLAELKGAEGTLTVKCLGRMSLGMMGLMEASVRPIDDDNATGFVRTPTVPGRDHLNPMFETRDGAEYCRCMSYLCRDIESVPVYAGEGFGEAGGENRVFRLAEPLEKLPEVPEGRRLLLFDGDMSCVYDSLTAPGAFKPLVCGYISLV